MFSIQANLFLTEQVLFEVHAFLNQAIVFDLTMSGIWV
jgi:hypothetical protein